MFMAKKYKAGEKVPRYVVMFQDNTTGVNLAVGSDDYLDFWKPLPKEHRKPGVGNEIQRVFKAFIRKVRVYEGKLDPVGGEVVEEKSNGPKTKN